MTAPTKQQIKEMADRAEERSRGQAGQEEFIATALTEGELNIEIAKLAALPIGVYESSRVENAKRLKMRASVLDALVAAKRPATMKVTTDFLPHWNVEPWPKPVDGAALLAELRDHFKRYVVLVKHADIVLALWDLLTWVFDVFDITPYLAITSPTRRCGKTLLMTMLYWLCCRAKKNDSMSKAAIYRSVDVERPTLVLDEVGWVLDLRDERQGILCGGFERLGHVEICEGEGADISTKRYSTYCPKAFGLIGKLTPTLMDRSIEIRMQRKLREKVERLRRGDNEQHAEFRRKCLRWANDNRASLATIRPQEPAGLNDRAFDAWEPLLAIAELVGGDWPKLATEAAIALSGGENVAEEKGIELLANIRAEFAARAKPAITSKTLIVALCVDEERPWATYNKGKPITERQLGKLLASFEIVSQTVHPYETGEAKDLKGYKLERFTEAFDRYGIAQNDDSRQFETSQASCRPNADETGITGDFSIRPESDQDGIEKCEKPVNHGEKDVRTDKNPKRGHGTASDHRNGGNGAGGFRCDTELAPTGDDLTIPPRFDRRAELGRVCAQCGAGRPGDLPTIAVTAKDGSTAYVHEHGCLKVWQRKNRGDQAKAGASP